MPNFTGERLDIVIEEGQTFEDAMRITEDNTMRTPDEIFEAYENLEPLTWEEVLELHKDPRHKAIIQFRVDNIMQGIDDTYILNESGGVKNG